VSEPKRGVGRASLVFNWRIGVMAGAYPKLSVVIPTLNEEFILSECISHVYKADPNVEIIVADGGSTDRTIKIAVEY
jgi:cellulose synthase/poly-beta-1,6-N-acetylglucosamine synthase-like glycosyltransferase